MSGKPQETQGDILDEIMGRDPAYSGEAPGEPDGTAPETSAAPQEAAPDPQDGKQQAPPAGKRNKRSAVYMYLLILFGAAFMMLLLAYFVQMRNNETTISDLKDSMKLSREQLLEEIESLEAKKEHYETVIADMDRENADNREQIQNLEQEASENLQTARRYYSETILANVLSLLERFCAEKDWLMAAVMVENGDYLFNEKNAEYLTELDNGPNAVQAARYLALREQVFENAGCMVIEGRSATEDDSDYTERPYIVPSDRRYDEETVETAKNLLSILVSYSYVGPDAAAYFTGGFCGSNHPERLENGSFQPSTVELFYQIKADLIEQGLLVENEDGVLSYAPGQSYPDIEYTLPFGLPSPRTIDDTQYGDGQLNG